MNKFTTKDHLTSMLFCSLTKCTSLKEISSAMLGLADKTKHFQLKHIPKKSTLVDTNQKRDAEVFGKVYNKLLIRYDYLFSDSHVKDGINKQAESKFIQLLILAKLSLKWFGFLKLQNTTIYCSRN